MPPQRQQTELEAFFWVVCPSFHLKVIHVRLHFSFVFMSKQWEFPRILKTTEWQFIQVDINTYNYGYNEGSNETNKDQSC